ncbi:thiamine biosynthesis protein thij [Plakobranchus ocellatus]|uniref:Thiamine biosynthesis protein thij n=1 Tax=Plakobranchus ocellatus TaxID=259542 RepID=A0AAV4D2H0_9GAST|nr:thiamine biosynthesis protein thij [Plakobranchus ocellatus]
MGKRILIILTSQATLGATDHKTGWYLPELAHPLKVLFDAGYKDVIDSVSPKGGVAPLDPSSVEAFKDDPSCQWLLKDADAQKLINQTKQPGSIVSSDYCAVIYPGGHGPMFDLASNADIGKVASDVYKNGGLVAAVCHGPAGLIPVKDESGNPIVKGRKVTSFTNAEEDAVKLTALMPFPLETKLKELGGNFQGKANFQNNVLVS